MTSFSKQLIENYYALFNQKDRQAFLNLLDENVIHDINQGASEVGKSLFASFMRRMDAAYDETIKDLVIMTNEDGTHASAEFMVEGTYLQTDHGLPMAHNQQYALRCGAFFEIKNNKIVRVSNYYNVKHWLQQIEGNTK